MKRFVNAVMGFILNPFVFVMLGYGLPFILLVVACTKEQRAIVRTVVDIVDQVCGDKDSVDECLGKAQAARAAARAGAAADAGVQDAAGE